MEGASNVCAEVRVFLQENPGSKMARRPFLWAFRGSAGPFPLHYSTSFRNGYAAPPIPAVLVFATFPQLATTFVGIKKTIMPILFFSVGLQAQANLL